MAGADSAWESGVLARGQAGPPPKSWEKSARSSDVRGPAQRHGTRLCPLRNRVDWGTAAGASSGPITGHHCHSRPLSVPVSLLRAQRRPCLCV